MTEEHLPELGQAFFSNGEFHEYPVPELMYAALAHLVREVERIEFNRQNFDFESPTGSGGAEWSCSLFVLRPYCWCDGDREGHESGCPPNFEFGDLRLSWYKHLGRSMSCTEALTPERIDEVLSSCLVAVRALDPAAIMRESECTSAEAAARSKEIQ